MHDLVEALQRWQNALFPYATPEQLKKWFTPAPWKTVHAEVDLRPGGTFRFVSRHHPDKPFTGLYRDISPPNLPLDGPAQLSATYAAQLATLPRSDHGEHTEDEDR